MLSTSPSQERAGQTARHEHLAVRAALEAIEALLKGLTEAAPDAARGREALSDLERLSSQLAEHFAHEEAADGLFAKALAEAPRLTRRVAAVREQHAPFAAELGRIVAAARDAGLSKDAWRGVAERFHAFAEAVREHEQEEGRIFADAYLDDFGSGD